MYLVFTPSAALDWTAWLPTYHVLFVGEQVCAELMTVGWATPFVDPAIRALAMLEALERAPRYYNTLLSNCTIGSAPNRAIRPAASESANDRWTGIV